MAKPMNKASNGKKEFAPSIGFWPAKSGNGFTVYLDEKVFGELQKAEIGGRLLLAEVTSDNDKAPAYRVTIFGPDKNKQNDNEL